MNNEVLYVMRDLSPPMRAALIGRLRKYVQDDTFINLFSLFDVNDDLLRNKSRPTNLYNICHLLQAFNGVPGLPAQVRAWLRSKPDE
jgi:hypothetical protein